jgi:hypothetical protein
MVRDILRLFDQLVVPDTESFKDLGADERRGRARKNPRN